MRQTLIQFYSILEKWHIQQPQDLYLAVAVVLFSEKVKRVILFHIFDNPIKQNISSEAEPVNTSEMQNTVR